MLPGRGGDGLVFSTEAAARAQAVMMFREDLMQDDDAQNRAQLELRGRDLACWCPLPDPGKSDVCHAAVLLEVANS